MATIKVKGFAMDALEGSSGSVQRITSEEISDILEQMFADTGMDFRGFNLNNKPGLFDDTELVAAARDGDYTSLITRLTDHVSSYFRTPLEGWSYLHQSVLPAVLGREHAKIWSAACAYGTETLSLAILVNDILAGKKHPDLQLIGTDINEEHLKEARREYGRHGLGYSMTKDVALGEGVIKAIEKSVIDHGDGVVEILPEVMALVEFKRHCLQHDEYPKDVDLIVCRNFLKYWSEKVRQQVVRKFYSSLRPGGVLWIDPLDIQYPSTPTKALDQFQKINDFMMYRKAG